jgi:hypothetical protein
MLLLEPFFEDFGENKAANPPSAQEGEMLAISLNGRSNRAD